MNLNQLGIVGQKMVEYTGNSPANVALSHYQNAVNPAMGPMGFQAGRPTPAIAQAAQRAGGGGSNQLWYRDLKPNNPQGLVARLMQEEYGRTQPKYPGERL